MRLELYVFLMVLIAACCVVDAARTGRIDLAREMAAAMRRDRTVQRIAALWVRHGLTVAHACATNGPGGWRWKY